MKPYYFTPRPPRIRPGTVERLERRARRIEERDLPGDYYLEIAIHQEIADCHRALVYWAKRDEEKGQ